MNFRIALFLVVFSGCDNQSTLQGSNDNYIPSFNDPPEKLSTWEKSLQKREAKNIKCSPQPVLPTLYLKSANNFYEYRNNRIYLKLNSVSGEFTRIISGEGIDNHPVFTRDFGCYYLREDLEDEPVNPTNYGLQILLDLELAASSRPLHPVEVFSITQSNPTNIEMLRFDDNTGVDWKWCPTRKTPFEYCTELRNGNIFYYPDNLDQVTKNQLKAEAILIRSEFNFTLISKEEFEQEWTYLTNTEREGIEDGWTYVVSSIPDVPAFIHRSWRDYLMGNRRTMPDASSKTFPMVCYDTKKEIQFDDGSNGTISGEACYFDGQYSFTEQGL
jgi:hypothetical protein